MCYTYLLYEVIINMYMVSEDLIRKIESLEEKSRHLEKDSKQRSHWQKKVINYTENFLENLENSKAYYKFDKESFSELYDEAISEDATDIDELLELIDTNLTKQGHVGSSGRHMAYIPSGGIYPAALGDYITDVVNYYAGVFFASPGAVRMENMLIRWMADLIGYPRATAVGNLCSGGSIASLIGIVSARDAFNVQPEDIRTRVIYLSSESHHAINKALYVSGLEHAQIRRVAMDSELRIDTNALEKSIKEDIDAGLKPFLVIATAGTTNTGAVDPFDSIADIAKKYQLWFHIDAAYGGFFMLTKTGQKLFKGIERSDSIAMDPHKTMFLPYGTGAALIKDRTRIGEPLSKKASYMKDAMSVVDEISPTDISPELSKHFRGLRFWLPLKLLGLAPFRAALDEKLLLAEYFYQHLSADKNFELGPKPQLSIVTFRYLFDEDHINDLNKKLEEEIQADGRVLLAGTYLGDKYFIRMAVVSFRTHLKDIDLAIEILKSKAEDLLKRE